MNKGFNKALVTSLTEAKLLRENGPDSFTEIAYDSRKIHQPEAAAFLAIKTKSNDGHLYLKQAYKQGVRNFIVDNPTNVTWDDVNIFQVNDTILAIQQLAAHRRANVSCPIVGITGSNGKTIVKEWLFHLLSDEFNICRSPKSYNSQLGVPLAVLELEEHHTLGIFEAGISEPDEMPRLAATIRPHIMVLTNIGKAHLENFQDEAELLHEKLKLAEFSHTVVIPHAFTSDLPDHVKSVSWSFSDKSADLYVTATTENSTTLHVQVDGESLEFQIPFADTASIENFVSCLTTLKALGVDLNLAKKTCSSLQPVSMRLEQLEGVGGSVIINDSYNADLKSLEIALDFLTQQLHPRKILVLSDIPGADKNPNHLQQLNAMLKNAKPDVVYVVGEGLSGSELSVDSKAFATTEELVADLNPTDFEDAAILLKGARSFGFEQLVRLLENKSHDAILKVDLSALNENLAVLRKQLKQRTKIMAMVKAYSYGSGTYEIANILQHGNVDYLAVAYVDEGLKLRNEGIKLPIMVMSVQRSEFQKCLQYQLEPEIYSLAQFADLAAACGPHHDVRIHLKVDTGMNRLGIKRDDQEALFAKLNATEQITIQSVFTHLAGADDSKFDAFTSQQISEYEAFVNEIEDTIGYEVIKHALNSAGIQRFPQHQFDMVRLGIGMYGIAADEAFEAQLKPVNELSSKILQIKSVKSTDTVGYNRAGRITGHRKIATIGIGYADGIDRRMGNGNCSFFVRDKFAPTIGNICMDMCMIDVTDVPNIKAGDMVQIFGNDISVSDLAKQIGTIPYEILTGISERVKRVYLG